MKEEIELLAMSQRSGSFESLENDHNDASSRNIGFTKSTEDITEIFSTLENTNESPQTVLIEGAPGKGKTFLSKQN